MKWKPRNEKQLLVKMKVKASAVISKTIHWWSSENVASCKCIVFLVRGGGIISAKAVAVTKRSSKAGAENASLRQPEEKPLRRSCGSWRRGQLAYCPAINEAEAEENDWPVARPMANYIGGQKISPQCCGIVMAVKKQLGGNVRRKPVSAAISGESWNVRKHLKAGGENESISGVAKRKWRYSVSYIGEEMTARR